VIQFTPPGSNASVIFGKNVNFAAPGSALALAATLSAGTASAQTTQGAAGDRTAASS